MNNNELSGQQPTKTADTQSISLPQASNPTDQSDIKANAPGSEDATIISFTNKDIETVIKNSHALAKKNSYEEAMTILEDARILAEKKLGVVSFENARLHYELGNVLLQKVETSRDVFGDAIKVNNKEAGVEEGEEKELTQLEKIPEQNEAEESKEEIDEIVDKKDTVEIVEESNENFNSIQQEKPAEEENKREEDVDDLQVVWEQLEVSRVLLEKVLATYDPITLEQDEDKKEKHRKVSKLLALVILRLGDANCYYDNFDAALQEYSKSLEILKKNEDSFMSRDLAECYYLIGNAHLYKNSEESDELALVNLNTARIILENILYCEMNSVAVKDPQDLSAHQSFLSKEFLKINIFETDKTKDLKEVLTDLYNKIEDTKEQKKERSKVAQELEKAKQMADQADKVESTFSKPILTNQISTDPNVENKPPKIIHLGTLGNAKKRNRDSFENPSKPIIPAVQQSSGNVPLLISTTTKESVNVIIENNQNGSITTITESVTKVDDIGHVEKMRKVQE